jgi:hypothetical protein
VKLYYLYVRHRGYSPARMATDGHIDLLDYMVKEKIVDEAVAVSDDYMGRTERATTEHGVVLQRQDGLDSLKPKPGDVVWVRGAWKPWIPWIKKVQERGNWLLYYDANTGHKGWRCWDIILSDLQTGNHRGKQGQIWLAYPKPVSAMFRFMPMRMRYDVCIGSSHIYDRKGQFRGYYAVRRYEDLYGVKLKCVMPGGYYGREKNTQIMRAEIHNYPNFDVPGHLPRDQLLNILNSSKVFLALTGGGYGDRGPVEAASCGCPIIMARTKRAAPYMYENIDMTYVMKDFQDIDELAGAIHEMLPKASKLRPQVAAHMRKHVAIKNASGPMMAKLFGWFRKHPKADRDLLGELM